MALLTELPLQDLFREFHYLAPFCVLLLCGVGLPIPEEVTLIGSGLLVYQGNADFVTISLVCSAAILLGDSIPYWAGRRFGLSILRLRWVSKVLHPERFELLERRFARHGDWAVFTCRFLPGIRIPGYFTAGTLGMRYWRFLLLDTLGVLISVPISIYLGKIFGNSVDQLRERFASLHLILAFGVLSLLLILVVRHLVRLRLARARARLERAQREERRGQAVDATELPTTPAGLPLKDPGDQDEGDDDPDRRQGPAERREGPQDRRDDAGNARGTD